ncbi:hypothetical protein BCR41DRAFT_1035 [Lobosporangium transversale]|uniref:Uncharacterized protein n=1 Tax=Lobosporangium transversale TaxID=64571 RepID=A0A1Y2H261_9FUNG|nr:hypothetical protein BCR41DRAFT_1035 [Lobosporangium transversale]ORZ28636.1 hypothetical protein BCR41DRAFT_1035 [Lobosporangium transversale]|eukprot:XP_021886309.1 hypothetical protein BCR41DRAFT_1035 [Lobosporangium transversale]
MTFGTDKLPWEVTDTPVRLPGVVTSLPVKNVVQQQINPFNHQYVSMNNLMNSRPSPEIKKEIKEEFIEPKIGAKVERTYADMSTQTKAKQEKYASEGGMMMMQRPATEKKKSKPAYKDMDPELLMMSAPAVPTSPMPTLDVEEASAEGLEEDREQTADEESAQEQSEVNSTVQQAPSTRFGSYVQRARAKQAAAAAAAAAAVTSVSTEPLDPLEAMTRQLAEIHLDKSSSKLATAKSVADSDEERMKKAAKAREMCAQNPERKQHADVLFTLLKSVHEMNRILAEYSSTQARHAQAGGAVPRHTTAGSVYPRSSGVYAQNQGQIRTVSSYLNRRSPYQPSSLQQEHRPTDPDYSQLRSSLAGDSGSEISTVTPTADETLVASDSPVLYPTTDLHRTEEVPFELSEEERRIIEEDNARIAAAKAAAEATGTQYTPV